VSGGGGEVVSNSRGNKLIAKLFDGIKLKNRSEKRMRKIEKEKRRWDAKNPCAASERNPSKRHRELRR